MRGLSAPRCSAVSRGDGDVAGKHCRPCRGGYRWIAPACPAVSAPSRSGNLYASNVVVLKSSKRNLLLPGQRMTHPDSTLLVYALGRGWSSKLHPILLTIIPLVRDQISRGVGTDGNNLKSDRFGCLDWFCTGKAAVKHR